VLAQTGIVDSEALDETIEKIRGVDDETKIYVERFLNDTGVVEQVEDVKSIEQIDLENPPEEVQVENVEDTDIVIYQVNYTQGAFDKNVYVVTFASDKFLSPIDIQRAASIEYLHFGENELSEDSRYLKTVAGVRSSVEKGYVMMEEGSIVGISTSAEILRAADGGRLDIIIYKNGENAGLMNIIDASETGVKKDYDMQASGVITFEPGDVISVYAKANGNLAYSDVINMIKIELP
jgi:hypothetical protein